MLAQDDFIQEAYDIDGNSSMESYEISNKETTIQHKTTIEKKPIKSRKSKISGTPGISDSPVKKEVEVKKAHHKTIEKPREPKKMKPKENSKKKKKAKTNTIITIAALVAIIVIILLILNINKLFPSQGTPVAIVNGELITSEDVEMTLKTVPSSYRSLFDQEQVLNQTITNKLLLQEADKLEIKVSKKDVEDTLEKTRLLAQMSKEEFEDYLKEQNLTEEEMKEFYKIHLAIEELLNEHIYKGINITKQEVEDFYNNNSESLGNITLEEVYSQLESFLLQKTQSELLNEYLSSLVASADIKILQQKEPEDIEFSPEEVEKYSSCSVENGLTKDTVLFVYSDSCPHCRNMKPIVEELMSEEYNFYWASASDDKARTLLRECFQDVLAGGVPQFICAKNGQTLVGARPEKVLREFADSCK